MAIPFPIRPDLLKPRKRFKNPRLFWFFRLCENHTWHNNPFQRLTCFIISPRHHKANLTCWRPSCIWANLRPFISFNFPRFFCSRLVTILTRLIILKQFYELYPKVIHFNIKKEVIFPALKKSPDEKEIIWYNWHLLPFIQERIKI